MGTLAVLWLSSLALAGTALATMLALIVRRVVLDAAARRAQARRTELTGRVLDVLESAADGLDAARLSRGDHELLVRIVGDLLRLVRGRDHERLIGLMRELGAVDTALALTRSRGFDRRAQAMTGLAFFREPRVIAVLTEALLHDVSARVRLAAALALAEMEACPPLRTLIPLLGLDRGGGSRRQRTLFRRLAATHTAEMAELLRGEVSPALKMLLLDALGATGDPTVLPALLDAARDPAVDVRAEAFRALSQLGHPAAAPVVAAGLGDPVWPVRAQAALCAGRVGLTETAPRLRELLADGEWWVRYRAAEALVDLGEPGLALLHAAAREPSAAGRVAQLVLNERRAA